MPSRWPGASVETEVGPSLENVPLAAGSVREEAEWDQRVGGIDDYLIHGIAERAKERIAERAAESRQCHAESARNSLLARGSGHMVPDPAKTLSPTASTTQRHREEGDRESQLQRRIVCTCKVLEKALADIAKESATARTEMSGASGKARGRAKVLGSEAASEVGAFSQAIAAAAVPASWAKRRREKGWMGASLEQEQLMGALLADVAKRTVEERMKTPEMPEAERFKWRWSKEPFVIAELAPRTWIGKRDRDEEPGPAQERERVLKRRKEDTRGAQLKWVGNALTLISGTTIVVLGRGI